MSKFLNILIGVLFGGLLLLSSIGLGAEVECCDIPHSATDEEYIEVNIKDKIIWKGLIPHKTEFIYENIVFIDDSVFVYEDDELIFRTDKDWKVTSLIVDDVDNDGMEELVMHLWKKGSYGNSKPFWEEGEDDSYKMHLFVYDLVDGEVKQLWHSSNLPFINDDFRVYDIDKDGKKELIVLERPYLDERKHFKESYVSIWEWNEWGFYLEGRSEIGYWDKLIIND